MKFWRYFQTHQCHTTVTAKIWDNDANTLIMLCFFEIQIKTVHFISTSFYLFRLMWLQGLYNHAYKFGAKLSLSYVEWTTSSPHTHSRPLRTKCVCKWPAVALMYRETQGCIHSIPPAAPGTCVLPLELPGPGSTNKKCKWSLLSC